MRLPLVWQDHVFLETVSWGLERWFFLCFLRQTLTVLPTLASKESSCLSLLRAGVTSVYQCLQLGKDDHLVVTSPNIKLTVYFLINKNGGFTTTASCGDEGKVDLSHPFIYFILFRRLLNSAIFFNFQWIIEMLLIFVRRTKPSWNHTIPFIVQDEWFFCWWHFYWSRGGLSVFTP